MQTKSILIFILFMLATISCDKISNETDSEKIILGKWKLIEIGNGDNIEVVPDPGGYIEYLSDSILIEYDSSTQESIQKKYWIDSLLHECFYLQEEKMCVTTGRFKYVFFDKNNKLRLDNSGVIANYNTCIYKRIK